MSRARPWLKFYAADWQSDEELRSCSLAARGLWIEMLALMHKASTYGHLLVSGRAPSVPTLAVLAGASQDQVVELLAELNLAGVYSVTRNGVIYSRRMVRDEKMAATSRKNGSKGGNPSLRKRKGNTGRVNPQDMAGLKPQKPETRGQKTEESPSPPSGPPAAEPPPRIHKGRGKPGELPLPNPGELTPAKIDDEQLALDAYNAAAKRVNAAAGAKRWRTARKIYKPASRREALREALREAEGLEGFKAALTRAEQSDYLCGEVDGFEMTIDNFVHVDKFSLLLEGHYDNRPPRQMKEVNGHGRHDRNGRSPAHLNGHAENRRANGEAGDLALSDYERSLRRLGISTDPEPDGDDAITVPHVRTDVGGVATGG